MIQKISFLPAIFHFGLVLTAAQGNNAVASGSIGECGVWDYPYTLYNNSSASETINNDVTVTVDQNRNIGSVNLSGTGTLDFNGANGISMSGSGTEITCRWDVFRTGSYHMVNNDDDAGAWFPLDMGNFFTAPQDGNYIYNTGSGWSANVSGSFLNAAISIGRSSTTLFNNVFYQDQAGSCGAAAGSPGTTPPRWRSQIGPISLVAGQSLNYQAGTVYSNIPGCRNTVLDFTLGNATIFYDN